MGRNSHDFYPAALLFVPVFSGTLSAINVQFLVKMFCINTGDMDQEIQKMSPRLAV